MAHTGLASRSVAAVRVQAPLDTTITRKLTMPAQCSLTPHTLAGALLIVMLCATRVAAVTHAVGPGQALNELDQVPWETLTAGDVVEIHGRAAPYRGKFVLARSGTAAQPITVRGVPDTQGELPVIDGNGAVTRLALDYWNEHRAVIKVGGASTPAGPARHIVIESLVVRGAQPAHTFTDDQGNTATYLPNAAAIFVEDGEAIVIRHCELTDSGNGLFVANPSRDISVEHSHLHGNGNVGSIYEHNSYSEALGMHYRFNRFGPLRPGAGGNNLKDRSAGLVVAYNWIEDGNRQLDLVESTKFARESPARYATTLVYGNVLVEHDGEGNRQIVHYGGDGGDTAAYRKGRLYFYHNTVVSERTGRTTLFRLSTNDEQADVRGNVFFGAGAAMTLEIASSAGNYAFIDNWIRADYVASFDAGFSGTITHTATISGDTPGFTDRTGQDYRPLPGAPLQDAGGALAAAVLPAHDVTREYVRHRAGAARVPDAVRDLGAFEVAPQPAAAATTVPFAGPAALAALAALLVRLARGKAASLGGAQGSCEQVNEQARGTEREPLGKRRSQVMNADRATTPNATGGPPSHLIKPR